MPLTEAENLVFRLTDPRTIGHDQAVDDELIKILQGDPGVLSHCLRILSHKVQSPCEREALNGLTLLENLAKHGGRIVQAELGKFRFLNELIKVVSPKYLGEKSTEAVKKKTIEMLYSWSNMIRYEQKIVEAYNMLKQQGIVKDDPVHVLEPAAPPPAPRAKNPVIEDDEKAKLLRRLLQSKDPSDMVAANRLIKSMVREDDQRMEKIIRRHSDLIQIKENAKLLLEMLRQFSADTSTFHEREIMRQLFDSCEQHRPRVFKLAAEIVESNTETEDGPNLGDILTTSDELTDVIQRYRALGLAAEKFGVEKTKDDKQSTSTSSSTGVLFSLDGSSASTSASSSIFPQSDGSGRTDGSGGVATPAAPVRSLPEAKDDVMSLLDDVFSTPNVSSAPVLSVASTVSSVSSGTLGFPGASPAVSQPSRVESNGASPSTPRRSLVDFDAVTHSFLGGLSLGDMNMKGRAFPVESKPRLTLSELQRAPPIHASVSRDDELLGGSSSSSDSSILRSLETSERQPIAESLDAISLNLVDIEPYPVDPLLIYQKNKINVFLHLTKNKPRNDCIVFVAASTNQNSIPVTNFALNFFAPKFTKIKLQPASSSTIPAHNPIFPSGPLSQILLVGKNGQDPLRLQYQISYTIDNQTVKDSGDITNIPEF